jgi:hypothetical protein
MLGSRLPACTVMLPLRSAAGLLPEASTNVFWNVASMKE